MHIKTVQNYKIIPSVILFFIYFSLKTSKINTNTVYMQQNMQTAYKKTILWTLGLPEYAVWPISCRSVREKRRKDHFKKT